MLKYKYSITAILLICIFLGFVVATKLGNGQYKRSLQVELHHQEQNAVKTSWPAIGCWFPLEDDFKPGGYKRFLDLYAKHSPFKYLTTSARTPIDLADPKTHDQIKKAAEYAQSLGIELVYELSVPFARQKFAEEYPGEMMQVVRLRDISLKDSEEVSMTIESLNYGNFGFYNWNWNSIDGQLLRVYSFKKGAGGVEDVRDITNRCIINTEDKDSVMVTIPCLAEDKNRAACVMAKFTLFWPDVFSPNLSAFEKQMMENYADVPLAGAAKDEWGYEKIAIPDDLWYSEFLNNEYSKRRPGHDLVRDLFLMSKGESGRRDDQVAAINHYMEMFWQRNGEIETKYYNSTKEVFGKNAVVGTHPTWYPYPGKREASRNGIDWWVAKRDLAQTDESTPFCVRTSLAKKWNSPLWYNMYYNKSIEPYEEDIWRHALGGGRMNIHPLYPSNEYTIGLLREGEKLFRADCRIRLLNYISTAPIDCPVAVVFSHPGAINWSGSGYGDAGVHVSDLFWEKGYYADLIPSSEIKNGALKVSEEGYIQYGPQKYKAVVFYQPQFERQEVGEFFHKAAQKGKTLLYCIGKWDMDFEGDAVNIKKMLPETMHLLDSSNYVRGLNELMEELDFDPQTTCEMRTVHPNHPPSMMPETRGECRLLDGTMIYASGKYNLVGDPIQRTFKVNEQQVSFDAVGIAAVRLDQYGKLEALAAGGLKLFKGGGLTIELDEPVDLALWRDKKGQWQGVIQDWEGPLPAPLSAITNNWMKLKVPLPYKP
jgi:hypothetical protein